MGRAARQNKWVDPSTSSALCWLSIDDKKGNPRRANCSLPPSLYSDGIAPFLRFDAPLPGQLYVVGGRNQQQDPLDVVEMFDTWHGEWVTCPSMTSKRAGCAAATLPDGRLLVVGGYDERGIVDGLLESCEAFDPRKQAWEPEHSVLRRPRWGHGCATLSGRVYAVGGCSLRPGAPPHEAFMETLRGCEVYDPALGVWSPGADLNVARAGARIVTLGTEYLAAVGGCDDVFGRAELLASLELFDVRSGCWALLSSQLSTPRTTAAVAALDDRRVLVVGGAPSLSSAEVYRMPDEQELCAQRPNGDSVDLVDSVDSIDPVDSSDADLGQATPDSSPALPAAAGESEPPPPPGSGDSPGGPAHASRGDSLSSVGTRLVRAMPEGRMGCQAAAMDLPAPGQAYPLCTRQCVVVVGGETGDEDWDAQIRQFSSILI